MTLEDLAVMVGRGFDHVVTKEEFPRGLDAVVTRAGFRKEMGELKGQIMRLGIDIARLKEEAHCDDPFVEDLLRRMRAGEKRVGMVK